MLARWVAVTDSGPAILLAVFVTASDHGVGRLSPLSASGMGRAAGEPGVSCGRDMGTVVVPQPPVVSEVWLQ